MTIWVFFLAQESAKSPSQWKTTIKVQGRTSVLLGMPDGQVCCCCSAEHGWGCGVSMQTTNQSWSFIAINSGIILDFQAPRLMKIKLYLFIIYLSHMLIWSGLTFIFVFLFKWLISILDLNLTPHISKIYKTLKQWTVNPGLVSVTDFITIGRSLIMIIRLWSHLDVVYVVVISWHYSWQWGRSLKL